MVEQHLNVHAHTQMLSDLCACFRSDTDIQDTVTASVLGPLELAFPSFTQVLTLKKETAPGSSALVLALPLSCCRTWPGRIPL
jgi:hypothetical protein